MNDFEMTVCWKCGNHCAPEQATAVRVQYAGEVATVEQFCPRCAKELRVGQPTLRIVNAQ